MMGTSPISDKLARGNANKGTVPDDADPTITQGSLDFDEDGTGVAELVADVGPDEDRLEAAESALEKLVRHMLGDEHADVVHLLDVTQVRAWGWNPATERPYTYFKAKVRRDLSPAEARVRNDFVERAKSMAGRGPSRAGLGSTRSTLIYQWADCQHGKGTDELFGDSTEQVSDRIEWILEEGIPRLYTRLDAAGYDLHHGILALQGDLTEGEGGSYRNQTHSIELDTMTQLEVATGWAHAVMDMTSWFHQTIDVVGHSSNHDKAARDTSGANSTNDYDDRTFTVLRTLGRVADVNPARYRNVRVRLPNDPNVAKLADVEGHNVAFMHGHVPNYRTNAQRTIKTWHDGQSSSNTAAGRCDVVCSAHFHHGWNLFDSGRFFSGARTLDNGSKHYLDKEGTWAMPGLRVLQLSADEAPKVHDLIFPGDFETARELFGKVAG